MASGAQVGGLLMEGAQMFHVHSGRKADVRMQVLAGCSGKRKSPQIPTLRNATPITYLVCILEDTSGRGLIFSHQNSDVPRN